ncbi:hypothetical protein EJB05_14083 [Eragrostis curvula]|uniref:Uncharacterized protein n=1 Tax=Eragrostis curvula TaxID=38414 RepID=A0A5J9VZ37_9POAL|nr:hypothetical protein EJB05_14083 [Eragrostis curvula]
MSCSLGSLPWPQPCPHSSLGLRIRPASGLSPLRFAQEAQLWCSSITSVYFFPKNSAQKGKEQKHDEHPRGGQEYLMKSLMIQATKYKGFYQSFHVVSLPSLQYTLNVH